MKKANTLNEKKFRLLPEFSRFPLLAAVVFNMLVYVATKPLTSRLEHHDITMAIDGHIPFFAPFIVFYFLAFVQWVVCYVLIARDSREVCYKYLSAEMIGKFITLLFFVLYPTTMTRADVVGTDFFSSVVRWIYMIDSPYNLFPSLHCFASWVCFRGCAASKKLPKWFKISNLILSLLVFASTVLIKQHVVIDIIGGVAVYEFALLIAKVFKTERIFEKLEQKRLAAKAASCKK